MLTLLLLTSSGLVVFTGLVIIALGEWYNFGLKFAALVLSTMSSLGVMTLGILNPGILTGDVERTVIFGFGACAIMRNLSTILFHLAVGRDAIKFRHRDRRSTCQMTLRPR